MSLFFHPQVRNEFYKDTQGVILVYDVGQKDSFDALDSWLAEMKQELGPHGNMDNVVFVVCANKVPSQNGLLTQCAFEGMHREELGLRLSLRSWDSGVRSRAPLSWRPT